MDAINKSFNLCLADAVAIARAAHLLQQGKLVAFPTETVYGLGGNARDPKAIRAIYALKGRPANNPLIVHVDDSSRIASDVVLTPLAETLMHAFWPGALTVILERSSGCSLAPEVSAGGNTVAIRMPAHPIARALLAACAVPIAAPSANASGYISPTTAQHVLRALMQPPAMVLDGGACPVGIESTVVDCRGNVPCILRAGSITAAMIAQATGVEPTFSSSAAENEVRSEVLLAPGLLESHYAPRLPVRLHVTTPEPKEAFLTFGVEPSGANHFCLSASGDMEEAARTLFACLHAADDPARFSGIAVMPIPAAGMGVAINDRLARAAAPRSV